MKKSAPPLTRALVVALSATVIALGGCSAERPSLTAPDGAPVLEASAPRAVPDTLGHSDRPAASGAEKPPQSHFVVAY
jgi:hypothetical protein